MTTPKTDKHKVFNDPIHGHIELPELCARIIDTPVFQRLRHIKQLGATYKVFPGASHNRFEHSLGVCHLAGQFVERLKVVQRELFKANPKLQKSDFEISDKDVLCLQVAGLCHDLGHGPLSHVFETYFVQKIQKITSDDEKKTKEITSDDEKQNQKITSDDEKKIQEITSDDEKKIQEITSDDEKKIQETPSDDEKKIQEITNDDEKKIQEITSDDEKKIQETTSDDEKKPAWTHEQATCDLLDHLWKECNSVSEKLEKEDLNFIKELIHKSNNMTAEQRKSKTARSSEKDFLYEIISNDENSIDVDKWDYFARDCYYLGFKNNFDHNRLIKFSRLIEVEEKVKEVNVKRWHICYREKEVENLYHMFYSRVILHKRACLHKTVKIIEIMYMEALEKVNDLVKVKGKNGKDFKISDCIHDPVAYCKLTDDIFQIIRHNIMAQTDNIWTQDKFKEAIQILDKIENRKLYKFVGEGIPDGEDKRALYKLSGELAIPDGEDKRALCKLSGELAIPDGEDKRAPYKLSGELAIPDGEDKRVLYKLSGELAIPDGEDKRAPYKLSGELAIPDGKDKEVLYKFNGEATPDGKMYNKNNLREEEGKVEDEISKLEIEGRKLDRKEFLINILEFSYGGKDNPVDKVYFYLKTEPDKAIRIKRDQVSILLPTVYREQVVRMYSKTSEGVEECRLYFKKWCREKKMKGKWQLYETPTPNQSV